ncbi:MAG: hypothetical protein A2X02_03215 [Bacteroidetes bacterium GWF2_29_10]|nr:MAG: hypothetical protein A2X02_03215 [Bacteroidetes bacterium GWF2_29_10]
MENQTNDNLTETDKEQFNNNKYVVLLPLIISISIIIGMTISFFYFSSNNQVGVRENNQDKKDKINNIIDIIEEVYVDSVNREEITENMISDMLQKLDPHSTYIPKKDLTFINEDLTGEFEGIGVQFSIKKDTIVVIQTIPLGPSEKVGIRSGDRIIKVNDTLFVGKDIDNAKVLNKLRGEKNTKVKLSIKRKGVKDLLIFNVTRAKIPTYSVDAYYMINKTTGYIKINKFAAQTYAEYSKAVLKLNKEGMKKLIIDLRANGGGYLEAAINIADDMLPEKDLIVYTKGKSKPESYVYATKKGNFEKGKLVILIDEWSASASEIVAGAIQDNDRGTIIGRRSFGKGLVQEQIGMPDGSAIRLTVARYYTPSGRSIQKPYDEGTEKYFEDFYSNIMNEYAALKDTITSKDTAKYYTKKGKIVFGGGGIYPDIYIPFDTTKRANYYVKIERSGIVFDFSFDYFDKNRKYFSQFKTIKDFDRNYNIDSKVVELLVDYAKQNGVEANSKEVALSELKIKNILKALIARNIFGENGFYYIYNQNDNSFIKAIETLEKE